MKKSFTLLFTLLLPLVFFAQQSTPVQYEQKALRAPTPEPEAWRAGGCQTTDTVTTYFDRATAFYRLTAGSSGYVFGTGSVSSETAVHYNAPTGLSKITEIMCYFTDISIVGATDSLTANVYTAATDSMPMTLIGSGKILVSDIDTSGQPTYIPVPNCQTFTGQFLVSIAHGLINDTVALFSNNVLTTQGGPDGNQEKRVRQYRTTTNQWERAWDIWTIQGAPLDGDAIVMPVVCLISCSGPPNAAFSSAPNSLNVNFTDMTTGDPPATWIWDFGDGNTSGQQNPSHTYAAPGTYTVCLTTTNSCGSDTSCSTVTLTCAAPSAAFSLVDQGNGLVSFTDMSSSGATLTNWLWDFGDGFTSPMQNPTHQYPGPGTYLVCLTVTDVCGTDSSCTNLVLSSCPIPTVNFNSNPAGNGVWNFNSTGSVTGSATYSWTFGDGNTANIASPSHTYSGNGTYLVCLTVTDSCGTDSFCQSISVTTVGIESPFVGALEVYPQPNDAVFTVEGMLHEIGNVELAVRDVLGKVVFRENWEASTQLIAQIYLLAKTSGRRRNSKASRPGIPQRKTGMPGREACFDRVRRDAFASDFKEIVCATATSSWVV